MLERIRAQLKHLKVPTASDRIFKTECMFSFATPESEGGLFINLTDFQAYGKKFLELDFERTRNVLYLNEEHHRVPLSEDELAAQDATPSLLANGVEYGFNVNKKSYKIVKNESLILMPEGTVLQLPCSDLPELLLNVIAAIQVRCRCNPASVVCLRSAVGLVPSPVATGPLVYSVSMVARESVPWSAHSRSLCRSQLPGGPCPSDITPLLIRDRPLGCHGSAAV